MSDAAGTILGLDHVVIRCAHFEQTLAFYRDVLGCALERSLEDIGLYQLRAGDSLIDLVPVGSELGGEHAPDPARANIAHICFRIAEPDWDHLRARLRQAGVETAPPARRYGSKGYGLSIYLDDPEGNVIELAVPTDQVLEP